MSRDCKKSFRRFLVPFALLLTFSLQARGLTILVTETNDTMRITSLRGAILVASRTGEYNTIILGQRPGLRQSGQSREIYHLTRRGADENAGYTGDLDITRGNITIIGVGAEVTIDATGLDDRVFQVFPRASLTLENLVITGGSSPKGANRTRFQGVAENGEDGGGIYNAGKLILKNCIITGNSSGAGQGSVPPDAGNGGNGGAIFNSGWLSMNACIISSNRCGDGGNNADLFTQGFGGDGGSGGGIYNAGTLILNASTISDNVCGAGGNGSLALDSSGNGGMGGNGGGIYNTGRAWLVINTLSGNTCGTGGDGTYESGLGGDGGSGGGIYNAGLLNLVSCTIAFNTTGINGNGIGSRSVGGGGGIFNEAGNPPVEMGNTMVAQNTVWFYLVGGNPPVPTLIPVPELAGDFISNGYNLIGWLFEFWDTGFTNGVKADQIGVLDPGIGPLQMNGGPTPTHALLPGSPAIDQGKAFGLHADQRGHRRVYNYPSIPNVQGGDGSDIGAFESDTRN